ncbi:MAG: MerR family transcriptional regulator [Proteobacteria bacterium]|nr:MerR family transcriptional regulator [Pseudomonadota bacterium]
MPAANPHGTDGFRIGDAAQQSGVSAANIRYYEKEGLLAPQARAGNDYRIYTAADVHQLRFIRLCRAMDMSLDEVRTLLALDLRKKADCALADAALREHISHARERLAELRTLEKNLVALQARCQGDGDRCHIIEALHEQADAAAPARQRAAPAKRHV